MATWAGGAGGNTIAGAGLATGVGGTGVAANGAAIGGVAVGGAEAGRGIMSATGPAFDGAFCAICTGGRVVTVLGVGGTGVGGTGVDETGGGNGAARPLRL